jgi:hypothetical protein
LQPPPTLRPTEAGTLPQGIVRVSQRADAIELYFPPLRAPAAAIALGVFGVLCLALPLFAISGTLGAIGGSAAHGLMSLVLIGAFVAPFPAFGAVFVWLAVYALSNSLTVTVNPSAIRTVRRVFGLKVSERELKRAEIAALEAQAAAKYQGLFSAEPIFRLVARNATTRKKNLVIAESLQGEAMTAQVQALIARHAGLAAIGATE